MELDQLREPHLAESNRAAVRPGAFPNGDPLAVQRLCLLVLSPRLQNHAELEVSSSDRGIVRAKCCALNVA